MKTPNFLVSILFVLVIFSCRKKDPLYDGVTCSGDCFIISGIIKDSASNTGIAGADIRIFFRYVGGGILPARKDLIGKAFSENNGNYTFRFSSSNYVNAQGYFYTEVYKDHYFLDPYYLNQSGAFNLETSNVNVPYNWDVTMFRDARLKVRLVADTVTDYQFLDVDYYFGTTSNGIVINGNGRKIDTIMEFKTAGDIGTVVTCHAHGNGINVFRHDTVVVPARGEQVVEFRF